MIRGFASADVAVSDGSDASTSGSRSKNDYKEDSISSEDFPSFTPLPDDRESPYVVSESAPIGLEFDSVFEKSFRNACVKRLYSLLTTDSILGSCDETTKESLGEGSCMQTESPHQQEEQQQQQYQDEKEEEEEDANIEVHAVASFSSSSDHIPRFLDCTPEHFQRSVFDGYLHPKTAFKGLYLCSVDGLCGGVLWNLIMAWITAYHVVGLRGILSVFLLTEPCGDTKVTASETVFGCVCKRCSDAVTKSLKFLGRAFTAVDVDDPLW